VKRHSHEPVRAGRDRPLRLAHVLHACSTHCTTGDPTSVHTGSRTDEQVAGTTYSYTSQSITQGAVTAQIARSCYRRWFQPCRRLYNQNISVYEHVYTFHRLHPCYASSSVSPANPRRGRHFQLRSCTICIRSAVGLAQLQQPQPARAAAAPNGAGCTTP
jgi:hypothetical protein